MPTNDERRQVAARLREKHGERQGTFEPQSMSIQAMNRLDDLLDCLPKRRDMFLDLADLIEPDPECECQIIEEEPLVFICSKCGGELEDWYLACPYCGCKVVDQ